MYSFVMYGLLSIGIAANYSPFQCVDIIGTVFDDQNGNGIRDKNERGLSSVRLVTINGVWVTTDRLGQFHLPCAAMPGRFGSKFAMKVYEPSLPHHYRVTTENPIVFRTAPGQIQVLRVGARKI